MTVRFHCEHCGHSIHADDRLAGHRGLCPHCGHAEVVPSPPSAGAEAEAGAGATFRLRPIEPAGAADTPAGHPHAGVASGGPHLHGGAAPREPRIGEPSTPYAVSGEDPPEHTVRPPDTHGHPLVRMGLGLSRSARNWLYVASVLSLALAAIGFLFKVRPLLHLGALLVLATNVVMLTVGLFYLVLLPFKEGTGYGLANLLFPPYAVYYWVTRWPRMKKPVGNTLASFTPIALVVVAYVLYEEAPVIEREVGRALPAVERTIEKGASSLEERIEEVVPSAGAGPGPRPGPGGSESAEQGGRAR